MTSNCTTTHFFAGSLKIRSGEAHVRDANGNLRRVVCTTPKGPGEVYYRDLDDGAQLEYKPGETRFLLTYDPRADHGRAGRRRFEIDYEKFCATTVDGNARRDYALAALQELPADAGESRAYAVAVAATYFNATRGLPSKLSLAVVDTNIAAYVDRAELFAVLAARPVLYRSTITHLTSLARSLPSAQKIIEGTLLGNPNVLARCEQCLARTELAIAMAAAYEGSIDAESALALACVLSDLHYASPTRDISLLRDQLVLASPPEVRDAVLTRAMPVTLATPDTAAADLTEGASSSIAEPPVLEPPVAADPPPAARKEDPLDQVRYVQQLLARESAMRSERVRASSNSGEARYRSDAVTASLDDLRYRIPSDEIRAGLHQVSQYQEEYVARQRYARATITAERSDEIERIASSENELVNQVLADITRPDVTSAGDSATTPAALVAQRDAMIRAIDRRLAEIASADRHSFESFSNGFHQLQAEGHSHRSDMIARLSPIIGGTSSFSDMAVLLERQTEYGDDFAQEQYESTRAEDRRRDLAAVLFTTVTEHYAKLGATS